MAVRLPGWKLQLTASTATCPPKRMVSPRVSRTGCAPAMGLSRNVLLALVLDRDRNVAGRDFPHQLQQVPFVGLGLLDAELVHVLHRLVVFLAEGHGALRRLEA